MAIVAIFGELVSQGFHLLAQAAHLLPWCWITVFCSASNACCCRIRSSCCASCSRSTLFSSRRETSSSLRKTPSPLSLPPFASVRLYKRGQSQVRPVIQRGATEQCEWPSQRHQELQTAQSDQCPLTSAHRRVGENIPPVDLPNLTRGSDQPLPTRQRSGE